MIGAYTEIDAREIPEAVNGKPRASQQGQGQREFTDNESSPQLVAATARARAAAILQRFSRVDP
jgi:hypothetical protein